MSLFLHQGSSSTNGASDSPYCIFKIPQCLTHNMENSYGYLPTIVSIGPYHNGEEQLKWIQGHKEKFQTIFVSKSGVGLDELTAAVGAKIEDIKKSYLDLLATVDEKEEKELKTMMVLDGCFLLTLFLTSEETFKEKNPILNMPWAMATIRRDILLLENQIPLLVLQILLNRTKLEEKNLEKIALRFFSPFFKKVRPTEPRGNNAIPAKPESNMDIPAESSPDLKEKHLLDLIRKTFIPITEPRGNNAIHAEPQINMDIPAESSPDLEGKHCLDRIRKTFISILKKDIPTEPRGNNAIPAKPQSNMDIPAESSPDFEGKHRLDLIRKTFISILKKVIPAEPQINNASGSESGKHSSPEPLFLKLKSAKTLYASGVKFKLKKVVNTFLDITFENGVLQIPEIILDDFTSVVLLNCIAFEQFYGSLSTDITSYIMFMGCLVNSERDAAYLVQKGIIQNDLGTDDEVVQFFKRILKSYVFDVEKSYLADVVREVSKYSSCWFHVGWAKAKQNYASSPWIFLSKLAGLALLLLTIAQVVLAAIALQSTPQPQVKGNGWHT